MFGVSNYPARSGSRGPLASMTVDDKITILVAVEQIDLTIEDVSWALGYHSATYGLRYSWTATLDALIGLLHDLDSPAHWRLGGHGQNHGGSTRPTRREPKAD